MGNLRGKLIRLAYQQPSLREHLIPILKVSANMDRLVHEVAENPKDMAALSELVRQAIRHGVPELLLKLDPKGKVPYGKGGENGRIRWHRYLDAIIITNLTFAGKRGKTVEEFSISDLPSGYDTNSPMLPLVEAYTSTLAGSNFETALQGAQALVEMIMELKTRGGVRGYTPKISHRELKGVRVDPPRSTPIDFVNPRGVQIRVLPQDFFFQNTSDPNLMSVIPGGRSTVRDTKKVWAWANLHQEDLGAMSYRDILNVLRSELGVRVHEYAAMD